MTDLALASERRSAWLQRDLRKVAAAATAGLVVGFVVNGAGSRLAMMLLARLNPQVTGRLSDDGFRMGQFTLADTAGLVFFGTAVGVLGGLLFLALRHLRFGAPWFRTASMVVGPAVVVGSMLVHTDGIDFRVLEPAWLAIGLFVALPGLFAYVVSRLVDRWLRDDAWPQRTKRAWAAGLVSVILLGPALLPVAGGLLARGAHQVTPALRNVTATRAWANAVRGALVVVFVLALRSLVMDLVELV